MQLRVSAPLLINSNAVLHSIALLFRSSTLAESATFVLLAIDRTNLRSSATLLAAPTDLRQYVQFLIFGLIIYFSLNC
jgi:hypothetical protein